MTTRVLIAIPCLDYVPVQFAMSLSAMVARQQLDALRRKAEFVVVTQQGSIVMDARNALTDKAQGMAGVTHLLFLDSDMSFPPNTLERLLRHQKPIVGATYVKRVEPYNLLGQPLEEKSLAPLRKMHSMPFGCMLIKMTVFDKLPRPYFRYVTEERGSISEDTWFCLQAREAGFDVWCDNDLTAEVGHVGTHTFRPLNV